MSRALVLGALLVGAPAACAATQLEFERTTVKQSTVVDALRITIGEELLAIEADASRTVYDFAARKYYITKPMIDGRTKQTSLYAAAAFRQLELNNRLILSGMLSNVGLKSSPMTPTLAEHDLGVTRESEWPDLLRTTQGSRVEFRTGTKLLAAFENPSAPADAADLAGFLRFVRQSLPVHPRIATELAGLDGIPSRLEVLHHGPESKVVLVFRGRREATEPVRPAADALRPEDGPLDALLVEAQRQPATELVAVANALDPHAAFGKGRKLEAMLTSIERNLALGGPADPWLQLHQAELVRDRDIKRLFEALGSKDKASAEYAAETFHKLRDKAGAKAYILKVFEANSLAQLGQGKQALGLFHAALLEAPHLVGAWKDLGDLYISGYRTNDAWRCWDFARSIAPAHGMLVQVAEYEKKLVREYPELF